jgi:hypothetical protein
VSAKVLAKVPAAVPAKGDAEKRHTYFHERGMVSRKVQT